MNRIGLFQKLALWLFETAWTPLLNDRCTQEFVLNRLTPISDKDGHNVFHSVDQMMACFSPEFFQGYWARDSGVDSCAIYRSVKVLDELIGGNWFIYEIGQSPAHYLWWCVLMDLDGMVDDGRERRNVFVEEFDTALDAVRAATKKAIDKFSKESPVEHNIATVATEQSGS